MPWRPGPAGLALFALGPDRARVGGSGWGAGSTVADGGGGAEDDSEGATSWVENATVAPPIAAWRGALAKRAASGVASHVTAIAAPRRSPSGATNHGLRRGGSMLGTRGAVDFTATGLTEAGAKHPVR